MARVVMTSSSARQVKSILWKELRRLVRVAKRRGYFLDGTIHKSPGNGFVFEDGREIVGFSTRDPEKMAGYSGANLVFILDEASGIRQEIFDTIEGNRAGGAKILMASNPTQTVGEFYEAFSTKTEFYPGGLFSISSEDTPNASGEGLAVPGLATKEWCDEMLLKWGRDDPRYQVRVLGNFPSQSEFAVFGVGLLDEAEKRWLLMDACGVLEAGVDPARYGIDTTQVCLRRGWKTLGTFDIPKGDGPDTAGKILELLRLYKTSEELPLVKVDVIGIGASVFDILARSDEVIAIAVDASGSPVEKEDYVKCRDEMWFAGVAWLKAGGTLPQNALLRGELLAPEYRFDGNGRCKVEPKAITKKKLKRSPDRADAFLLSVYQPLRPAQLDEDFFEGLPERRW